MGTVRRCARYTRAVGRTARVLWKVRRVCRPVTAFQIGRHDVGPGEWARGAGRSSRREGIWRWSRRRDVWFLGCTGKARLSILALIALFP